MAKANKPRVLDFDMSEFDVLRLTRTDDKGNTYPAAYIHVLQFDGMPCSMAIQLRHGANLQGVPVAVSYDCMTHRPTIVKI